MKIDYFVLSFKWSNFWKKMIVNIVNNKLFIKKKHVL